MSRHVIWHVFRNIFNSIDNQFTTRNLPLDLPLILTCVVRSGMIREATYRDNDDDRNRKRPDNCSICRHPAAEK